MLSINKLVEDPSEALAKEIYRDQILREDCQQKQRVSLRDFATQLREPGRNNAGGPASFGSPSFKLSEAEGYTGVTERHKVGELGHLSPQAVSEVKAALQEAGRRNDPGSRDRFTGNAAKAIAKDWDAKHGHKHSDPGVLQVLRQEARAQVVFAAREIGAKVGLGPAESTIVGYSLARALEKEGFKVMASSAIDKASDLFKGSSGAAANTVGRFAAMEKTFDSSVKWLAEHGVNKDNLKKMVGQHTGKFLIAMEIYQNPELVRNAAQVLSQSDKAYDLIKSATTDTELRKAVGTLVQSSGESLNASHVGRGVGSMAVLAGAAMRGESSDDMGRHVFRAGMAFIGGAAGGLAAGAVSAGFGSVVGATLGASAMSAAADAIIKRYDEFRGIEPNEAGKSITQEQLKESTAVLSDRLSKAAGDELNGPAQKAADVGREMSMTRESRGM